MKHETLRMDERISIALRTLYRQHGYLSYQVNTFEEYDLYMKSRSMLQNEQILTFPGEGGTLMALKPDITLSIARNAKDEDAPLKVFYAERIYRVPKGADGFEEILQTGVESIGVIDDYAMGEVLLLAARSLKAISPAYMLDVSHMGFVSAMFEDAPITQAERAEILACIGEKNLHGLTAACAKVNIKEETAKNLAALVAVYGPMDETLKAYEAMALPEGCAQPLKSLRTLCDMLKAQRVDNVNLDFSVVGGMNYYNGLIFSGFIAGIPQSVLSGGRYDLLMRRMGRQSDAIGFAVYLNQIERLSGGGEAYDADVLIVTDDSANPMDAMRLAQAAIGEGKTVRAQQGRGTIRAKEIIDMTQKEAGQ